MKGHNSAAVLIFVFFVSFYSFFSIGHFGGDGYEDYLTAESIVLDHNLSLNDRPQDKDELEYKENPGMPGRDGKTYSSRGSIGMPLLIAPFYFIGDAVSSSLPGVPHDYVTMLFVSFLNPLLLALACAMMFRIGTRLGFSPFISAALSLVTGLSTMAPVYARTGFAEPALALFMLLAVDAALKYKASLKTRDAVLAAVFVSFMAVLKPSALIFAPCFIAYIVITAWACKTSNGRKVFTDALMFSLVFAVFFAAILVYNFLIYGSIFAFGGTEAVDMTRRIASAPHVLKGLYYYLFSTGKGFFIYNLPIVLSFVVLGAAFKKNRNETILFLLLFAVDLLFFVKSFRRGSLFSWGPRYLMPVVPVLAIFLGFYLERFKSVFFRSVFFLLSLAGFLVILPCMFINQSKFYFFLVEKLGIEEYMINFVPDLFPVKGAWCMLISGLTERFFGQVQMFAYDPDYRLVKPISAAMTGYNYLDLWFLKVLELAPKFSAQVYTVLFCLAAVAIVSLLKVLRGPK